MKNTADKPNYVTEFQVNNDDAEQVRNKNNEES